MPLNQRTDQQWQRWGLLRQFKLTMIRLLRLKSTPDAVARGVALGVFVGFTPFFGFHILIAVVLAFLFRQNKIAAFAGVWITNPLSAPFIYGLEYEVGRMLLGMPHIGFVNFRHNITWEMARQIGTPLFLGSLVLGVPIALISYALTVRLLPGLRQYRIPRWPRRLRRLLPVRGHHDRDELP